MATQPATQATTRPTTQPAERPKLVAVRWSYHPFAHHHSLGSWNRIELKSDGLHHGNQVWDEGTRIYTKVSYQVSPEVADEFLNAIVKYADGMPRLTDIGLHVHFSYELIELGFSDGSTMYIRNGLGLHESRLGGRAPHSQAYARALSSKPPSHPSYPMIDRDDAIRKLGTTRREYLTRIDLEDILWPKISSRDWLHARMVWFEITHTLQRAVLEAQWSNVPAEESETRTRRAPPSDDGF